MCTWRIHSSGPSGLFLEKRTWKESYSSPAMPKSGERGRTLLTRNRSGGRKEGLVQMWVHRVTQVERRHIPILTSSFIYDVCVSCNVSKQHCAWKSVQVFKCHSKPRMSPPSDVVPLHLHHCPAPTDSHLRVGVATAPLTSGFFITLPQLRTLCCLPKISA